MSKKTKISPTNTFILDDSDLEELDELSMTAIIGEVTESFKRPMAPTETEESAAAREPDGGSGGNGGSDGRSEPDFEYDPEIAALMRELDDPS